MIQVPIVIKDNLGFEYTLRTPKSDEAKIILESITEIAVSSPYILSTPESFRQRTVESQVKWIEDAEKSDVAVIIGAYDLNNKIVGFCNGQSYKDIKRKHRAALGISIHPDYRQRGIGNILMEVLIANMKKFAGIKIIELDVMLQNLAAVKMYEKLGFKRAGIFPNAYILPTGEILDNLTMYMQVD